jgi:hypothetical protein
MQDDIIRPFLGILDDTGNLDLGESDRFRRLPGRAVRTGGRQQDGREI